MAKSVEKEIWKTIPGFPDYLVSTLGRFYSVSRKQKNPKGSGYFNIGGCVINGTVTNNGYIHIGLSRNCIPYLKLAHRMVAITFIPNPNNYPVVNHLDANPKNNQVFNLAWCDQSQNVQHTYDIGRYKKPGGEASSYAKLKNEDVLRIRRLFQKGLGVTEIGRMYSMGHSAIGCIVRRKTWKHI